MHLARTQGLGGPGFVTAKVKVTVTVEVAANMPSGETMFSGHSGKP